MKGVRCAFSFETVIRLAEIGSMEDVVEEDILFQAVSPIDRLMATLTQAIVGSKDSLVLSIMTKSIPSTTAVPSFMQRTTSTQPPHTSLKLQMFKKYDQHRTLINPPRLQKRTESGTTVSQPLRP